jgi:hypothetical protein
MTQIPANLAQRILDAARIAAAMHRESSPAQLATYSNAGGAGLAVVDHDGRYSTDGIATPQDRLRPRIR